MLVLTRTPDEGIRIGDDVVIKVGRIRSSNAISVAIDAPPDVAVKRSELSAMVETTDPATPYASSEGHGASEPDDALGK